MTRAVDVRFVEMRKEGRSRGGQGEWSAGSLEIRCFVRLENDGWIYIPFYCLRRKLSSIGERPVLPIIQPVLPLPLEYRG